MRSSWLLPAVVAVLIAGSCYTLLVSTPAQPPKQQTVESGGQPRALPKLEVAPLAENEDRVRVDPFLLRVGGRAAINQIEDGGYIWEGEELTPNPTRKIRLKTNACTVTFTNTPDTVTVKKDGKADTNLKVSNNQLKLGEIGPRLATYTFFIDNSPLRDLTFSIAGPSTDRVEIANVFNGKYADRQDPSTNQIKIYDNYIKLQVGAGDRSIRSDQFSFFEAKATPPTSKTLTKITVLGSGRVEGTNDLMFELKLGTEQANTEREIHVRFSSEDTHAYSTLVLSTKVATADTLGAAQPKIVNIKVGTPDTNGSRAFLNSQTWQIKVTGVYFPDTQLRLFSDSSSAHLHVVPVQRNAQDSTNFETTVSVDSKLELLKTHRIYAALVRGLRQTSKESAPFEIQINTNPPYVLDVQPRNFGTAPGVKDLKIFFSKSSKLTDASATLKENYNLIPVGPNGEFSISDRKLVNDIHYDSTANSVTLSYAALPAQNYRLELLGRPRKVTKQGTSDQVEAGIVDIYGNFLEGVKGQPGSDCQLDLFGTQATDDGAVAGIRGHSQFVKYHEYTRPRQPTDGFNPGDHVQTRVVRLYYFRDGHRVAQIINRDARAHNGAAVTQVQRAAEESRTKANEATDERRGFEVAAVEAAKKARALEGQIQQFTQFLTSMEQVQQQNKARLAALDASIQQKENLPAEQKTPKTDDELRNLKAERATLDANIQVNSTKADNAGNTLKGLFDELQQKRTDEIAANEKLRSQAAREDRLREDQFRKEVAAKHADPDTFARGVPNSYDPVQQVSVTVLGESSLQLRGPISGINTIRKMIHEIDSPAGQVKVAIHTVQVNGEHGDRMEKVIGRIQDYIDHSRFLTMQSAQMLRKAIVQVASRKAHEAALLNPQCSQMARDERYLYSFFGKDFVDELRAMNSEFLKTGNKLLSLNSMDSTSLAAALTVLALAKNDTRREILAVFHQLLESELPASEQRYFEAGGARKYGHCHPFSLMAQNAKFESFFGFFNAEVVGDDTLTPSQREFIRLAQIMKAQLITELELKQRITERAMIEDRMGNYRELLKQQQEKEGEANKQLQLAQDKLGETKNEIRSAFAIISGELLNVSQSTDPAALPDWPQQFTKEAVTAAVKSSTTPSVTVTVVSAGQRMQLQLPVVKADCMALRFNDSIEAPAKSPQVNRFIVALTSLKDSIGQFRMSDILYTQYKDARKKLRHITEHPNEPIDPSHLKVISEVFGGIAQYIVNEANRVQTNAIRLLAMLDRAEQDAGAAYALWADIRQSITEQVKRSKEPDDKSLDKDLYNRAIAATQKAENSMVNYVNSFNAVLSARQHAAESRRPLDHKKLLDMLINEAQEKNVELLEGVRSHTANIDEYIKRIATSLEDDFNTQFYFPAFREVRNASRMWDVTLGQIETTSILTNNRTYAKVEPQATMEFDLPQRKIMISEALSGAKAAMDTYGALLQDPTFLSMGKLYGGQPTSQLTHGQGGGFAPVRPVLPGLARLPDERALSSVAPSSLTYGNALDALVPEPAIYKFETGTGFDIRPVIQPDGQSVLFGFNYMYTTNIREPVRPDEKHLGRVKRHFIDTNVHLANYELREISRYQVALKAARTAKGVPLLQDIPGVGILFRPLPSAESSLQQNLILGQATIYPTLFDLMGLRWAPVVSDIDPLALQNAEFVVRQRSKFLMQHVFDMSTHKVDEALRIPDAQRRTDLYRAQETIPAVHPNGYFGPGLGLRDSHLQEGYDPRQYYPKTGFAPSYQGQMAPPLQPQESPLQEGYQPGQFHPQSQLAPYGLPTAPVMAPPSVRAPAGQPAPQQPQAPSYQAGQPAPRQPQAPSYQAEQPALRQPQAPSYQAGQPAPRQPQAPSYPVSQPSGVPGSGKTQIWPATPGSSPTAPPGWNMQAPPSAPASAPFSLPPAAPRITTGTVETSPYGGRTFVPAAPPQNPENR